MGWDRSRKVHYPFLVIQWVVCVGCWVAIVLAISGSVSRAGLVASGVTAWVLVGVTWVLAKMGIPPPPVQ
jgi:hypothetical protein